MFKKVNLTEESDDLKLRQEEAKKKKPIKSSEGAGQNKGFFANLFGCCSSKKQSAPASNGAKKPEQKPREQ